MILNADDHRQSTTHDDDDDDDDDDSIMITNCLDLDSLLQLPSLLKVWCEDTS